MKQQNLLLFSLSSVTFVAISMVVLNTLNVQDALAQSPAPPYVPAGSIVMWEGTSAPPGWCILDGADARCPSPDLSDRFILGGSVAEAGRASSSGAVALKKYLLSDGTDLVTSAEGNHVHELYHDTGMVGGPNGLKYVEHADDHGAAEYRDNIRGLHVHHVKSADIKPPYYRLMFIKKL